MDLHHAVGVRGIEALVGDAHKRDVTFVEIRVKYFQHVFLLVWQAEEPNDENADIVCQCRGDSVCAKKLAGKHDPHHPKRKPTKALEQMFGQKYNAPRLINEYNAARNLRLSSSVAPRLSFVNSFPCQCIQENSVDILHQYC